MISVKYTKDFRLRNLKLNTNSGVSMYNIYLFKCSKIRSTAVEMHRIQDLALGEYVLPCERLHIDFPLS